MFSLGRNSNAQRFQRLCCCDNFLGAGGQSYSVKQPVYVCLGAIFGYSQRLQVCAWGGGTLSTRFLSILALCYCDLTFQYRVVTLYCFCRGYCVNHSHGSHQFFPFVGSNVRDGGYLSMGFTGSRKVLLVWDRYDQVDDVWGRRCRRGGRCM